MDPIGLGVRIRAFMWFYFGIPSALFTRGNRDTHKKAH